MAKLSPKRLTFCKEYLVDLNGTQAAIRAGYSKKTAGDQAKQMLHTPSVKKEVERLLAARSKRTEITADLVLGRLDDIGGLDIGDCFDDNGRFKNIKDIPKEIRKCIASIEVFEEFEGVGRDRIPVGEVRKIKFNDKIKANELIGRNLKMWVDRVEHKHSTLEQLVGGSSEAEAIESGEA